MRNIKRISLLLTFVALSLAAHAQQFEWAKSFYGYGETVHLRYNPSVVSLRFLLEMYFKAIDPTSFNKQGEDEGTRYRTGIYYTDPADRAVIDDVMAAEAKKYGLPLQVEVEPLRNFYSADEYHQDYLDKNPTGYCHLPVALFELARNAKERR